MQHGPTDHEDPQHIPDADGNVEAGERIGFIGIGNLGRNMVLNLLDHGWPVTVMDRSRDRLVEVCEAGATAAASIADVASCRVICLAVPDDDAVTALTLGSSGLLERLSPAQTLVVHSTILPATARSLGQTFKNASIGFLDAPVSGGADRARKGQLTLMVGGEDRALDAVGHFLNDIATEVIHIGKPGAGAATKLANQLMMFSALAGTHEALRLAAAYDVAGPDVLRTVATSTGDTWVARNWGFFDEVASDYNRMGIPVRDRPWSKDLSEVVTAARTADVNVPFAALLAQILPAVVEEHATRGASGSQPTLMDALKGATHE